MSNRPTSLFECLEFEFEQVGACESSEIDSPVCGVVLRGVKGVGKVKAVLNLFVLPEVLLFLASPRCIGIYTATGPYLVLFAGRLCRSTCLEEPRLRGCLVSA